MQGLAYFLSLQLMLDGGRPQKVKTSARRRDSGRLRVPNNRDSSAARADAAENGAQAIPG